MFQVPQSESKRWYLSKRSLAEGSNVLIVDDFMKAGGTIKGMMSMLEEFNATC